MDSYKVAFVHQISKNGRKFWATSVDQSPCETLERCATMARMCASVNPGIQFAVLETKETFYDPETFEVIPN